jgi:hypothetical protein
MQNRKNGDTWLLASWVFYGTLVFLALCAYLGVLQDPGAWQGIITGLATACLIAASTGAFHTLVLQREINQATCNWVLERVGRQMTDVGLDHVYPRRPLDEMESAINSALSQIKIVGASLNGLLGVEFPSEQQERILNTLCDKAARKVIVHILMTDPLVASHREKMEIRAKGSIPIEIVKNLVRLINKLPKPTQEKPVWMLALYSSGPTAFTLEVDKTVLFLEPYPLAATAMDNLCFKCNLKRDVTYFSDFERNHVEMPLDRPKPDPIRIVTSLSEVTEIVCELENGKFISADQASELREYIKQNGNDSGSSESFLVGSAAQRK